MINLSITAENLEKLTWEQWELFDTIGEKPNYHKLREIVAVFVADMDYDQAMDALGKLRTSEIKSVSEQFAEKINELRSLNPQKSGG